MHTVIALLCFVVVIHWLISPYPSGLLHWHCGNLTIVQVPAKQPWWIWKNTSCEFIMNDCVTTTKQSTTKPCAYVLGYIVCVPVPHHQGGNIYSKRHTSDILLISRIGAGYHNGVIKGKHFPRYRPFVREIRLSPVNSPHKGQWRGTLMFSLICAWINGRLNKREAGDLRRHRARYDITVMTNTGVNTAAVKYIWY